MKANQVSHWNEQLLVFGQLDDMRKQQMKQLCNSAHHAKQQHPLVRAVG